MSVKVTTCFHKIQKALKHHDEYREVYKSVMNIPIVANMKEENSYLKKEVKELKELVFKYEKILHWHNIRFDEPEIHVEKIKTEDVEVNVIDCDGDDVQFIEEKQKENVVYELEEDEQAEDDTNSIMYTGEEYEIPLEEVNQNNNVDVEKEVEQSEEVVEVEEQKQEEEEEEEQEVEEVEQEEEQEVEPQEEEEEVEVEEEEEQEVEVEQEEEEEEEVEVEEEEEVEEEVEVEEQEEVEEEEEEVEEVEEEEVEVEEQEEVEEEEDLYEIKINGVKYATNNEQNGLIYELVFDGDVGDVVGAFKNGKPHFNKK
jgi:hypothetical protein